VGIGLPPVAQCPYNIREDNPEIPVLGIFLVEGLRVTGIVQIIFHPVAEFADDIFIGHVI